MQLLGFKTIYRYLLIYYLWACWLPNSEIVSKSDSIQLILIPLTSLLTDPAQNRHKTVDSISGVFVSAASHFVLTTMFSGVGGELCPIGIDYEKEPTTWRFDIKWAKKRTRLRAAGGKLLQYHELKNAVTETETRFNPRIDIVQLCCGTF